MERSLRSVYDVQQLLKQFGIFVYVGERLWDIELMMDEIKKIYQHHLIDQRTYLSAMAVLKKEHQLEIERSNKNE